MTVVYERLPDINTERDFRKYPLLAYGRFALLRDGTYWFGDLHSSHPTTTHIGWYWAISLCGNLIISSRGASSIMEISIKDYGILEWLIGQLVSRGIIRKPKSILITLEMNGAHMEDRKHHISG